MYEEKTGIRIGLEVYHRAFYREVTVYNYTGYVLVVKEVMQVYGILQGDVAIVHSYGKRVDIIFQSVEVGGKTCE